MYLRTTQQITLAGAMTTIDAILAEAALLDTQLCVAVVDPGGHLIAFARTDEAELQTINVAESKARSAALSGIPTGPVSRNGNSGSDHHLLAITLAAGPDNFVTVQGGLPIIAGTRCVGGVAVSGAGRRDSELAATGIAALTRAMTPGEDG